MQRCRRGLGWTWAGVGSALLLGLFVPTTAQATCGDYLHRPAHSPPERQLRSPSCPPPHPPCQGPSCPRQKDAPLSAPVSQPTSNPNDSAQLPPTPTLLGSERPEALSEPGCCASVSLLGSI